MDSVYQKVLVVELRKNDLKAEVEKPLKVYNEGEVVGDFYVDLRIEN